MEALGPGAPTRMEGKKNQRLTVPGLSPKLSPGAQHQALAPVLAFPSLLTPHSHLGGEFPPSLCPEGSHTCADQLVCTPASAVSTSPHPTESLRLPCRGRRRDCQKRKRLSSRPTTSRPGPRPHPSRQAGSAPVSAPAVASRVGALPGNNQHASPLSHQTQPSPGLRGTGRGRRPRAAGRCQTRESQRAIERQQLLNEWLPVPRAPG